MIAEAQVTINGSKPAIWAAIYCRPQWGCCSRAWRKRPSCKA